MASGNTEIVANIKRITNELNGLKYAAKDASASAKLVSQAFEAGIGGKTAIDAYNAYQIAIDKTNNAISEYSKKIAELETLQNNLDKSSKTYAADFTALSGKIVTQKNALAKLNEQLIELTLTQKKYSAETIATAAAEKQAADVKELAAQKTEKLKKYQSSLDKTLKVSIAIITALVAALKRMTSAAIEQGTELYSLSKRYGATVEEIQDMNRALQLATGQSDLFTNSLAVLAKGMSDIAGNRGQKYTAALKAIGLSYKELSEKTRKEQFSGIIEGLMAIENETVRAAHAQTLLGESGQYLVGALQDSKYTLDEYLEQAEKYGKITTKNAEALTFMSFRLEAIKSQISAETAQLVIDLEPAITTILKLIKSIVPILNALIGNGWGLYFLILTILGLKVATTFLNWRIELLKTAAAAGTAATKFVFLKAVTVGIAAAGIAVAGAIALASSASKQLGDNLDSASNAMDKINTQSGDFNTSIENYSTQSTERTITMNVDIHGEGDTAVSDEAAQTVAQLTANELQKRWGDLVK